MRINCILENEKYSTRVFHNDIEHETVVQVIISDEDLDNEIKTATVEDVILVITESETTSYKGGDTE